MTSLDFKCVEAIKRNSPDMYKAKQSKEFGS